MKRKINKFAMMFCGLFLVSGGFNLFAEKANEEKSYFATEDVHRGLSISGLWESDSLRAGGGFELGISLSKEKRNFVCRDYFTASGYGWYAGLSEISVGNKLQLGNRINSENFIVIPYGFVQVNASILLSAEKEFGFWIGGGGGFEFHFHPTSSFFIEYGGRGLIPKATGTSFLTIGYRQYL